MAWKREACIFQVLGGLGAKSVVFLEVWGLPEAETLVFYEVLGGLDAKSLVFYEVRDQRQPETSNPTFKNTVKNNPPVCVRNADFS